MTDETKPEIRPRIDEDGEAWCTGGVCPAFHCTESCGNVLLAGKCAGAASLERAFVGLACIPALRRQRDEARARVAELQQRQSFAAGNVALDQIESRDRQMRALIAERDEALSNLAETAAILEAVEAAIAGEPVDDFMESFPAVRAAVELRQDVERLRVLHGGVPMEDLTSEQVRDALAEKE